jgi:hypothetical protein
MKRAFAVRRISAQMLSAVFATLLCLGVNAQTPKPISLKGERVCLQRKPDENGRVLLDCAIGFRGDDEQFYGLRAASPSVREPFPSMAERVVVTGQLIPGASAQYEESGLIVYESIRSIQEPKAVKGTVACVDHGNPGIAPSGECRLIVKTDGGLHWGLYAPSLESIELGRSLKAGDRISVEAEILWNMPQEWQPWAYTDAPHRIEGLLRVQRLERR